MSALFPSASGLAVGRARFSGPGASRALLEQALNEVALDRLGLAPEEVLYVPRLVGPARLRAGATRHFANGIGLALGDIAGRAERDPVGGKATDRPCRFSSRAAFAAWLIGSVLDKGSAEAAALVRAATARSSPRDWWRSEVLGDGRTLVRVLVRLAGTGDVIRWLARLDAFEVEIATASLTRDYGLAFAPLADRAALASGADHPLVALPDHHEAEADRYEVEADRYERAATEEVRAACAAIAARGELLAALPVAPRRLLAAALVLARAPAIPRTALARAIEREISAGKLSSGSRVLAIAAGVAPGELDPTATPDRAEPAPARAVPPKRQPYKPIVTSLAPDRGRAPEIDEKRMPVGIEWPRTTGGEKPRAPHIQPAIAHSLVDRSHDQTPSVLSEPQLAFDTAFGGLAFLINAFLAMGLYPDFTRPLDPALQLAPLALADRLGVHWFGARYRRDPLRRWIEERGTQGPLPRRWRVDRQWLSPFPGGRSWHDGSMLWHSAGFPLADHIAGVSARRLARELGVPRDLRAPGRRLASTRRVPDWLDCLALFLAARFRRAAPDDALTPAALAIPGRVVVDDARLDFRFALTALPIALRLAGLDRDPGWLPAEGRDVRFHFE